jgi:hypothetical protein
VPEVHVRDDRKVLSFDALQDDLVELLALLRGVVVRTARTRPVWRAAQMLLGLKSTTYEHALGAPTPSHVQPLEAWPARAGEGVRPSFSPQSSPSSVHHAEGSNRPTGSAKA